MKKTNAFLSVIAIVATATAQQSSKSASGGEYEFTGVPRGKANIKISYVGKLPIEKTVDINSNTTLNFTMVNENFKIKEVTVTAQVSQSGAATSSLIGRTAIDHMQATSLNDIMSLLPGELSSEPNLSSNKVVTLRSLSSAGTAMNAPSLPHKEYF
jgi:hypothetical protein